MRIQTKFDSAEKVLENYQDESKFRQAVERLAITAQADAQNTVNTFVDEDGHKQGVHSGAFRDSIHYEIIDNGYGFALKDGVKYGIYHEFGTVKHFVPFVDETGNLTGLGKWAVQNFSRLGYGTGKEKRTSREEIVKSKGGIMVSLDEMAPFRKAMDKTDKKAPEIFRKVFTGE